MESINYFSKNIKYLRNSQNLSQEQLGILLNKNNTTIGKWENGTRFPTMEDTLEVCNFFNISLNDLISKNLQLERYQEKDELDELFENYRNDLTESDIELMKTIMKNRIKEIDKELDKEKD